MATVTSASNAPAPTPASAVTTAGEHVPVLSHYVEDTAASPDRSSYFRPVEDVLDFDGRDGSYQRDIAAKASISLPRSAIDDAANHGDSFVSMPSPTTINRRAKIRPQAQTVPSRLCRWHER